MAVAYVIAGFALRARAQQSQSVDATRERMLREITEAIERISEHSPLLLVLEDLHWSDYSTLDLIAHLSRRKDRAQLMVIGTYRPVDVILAGHPLRGVKRELQAHRLCHELPLNTSVKRRLRNIWLRGFRDASFPAGCGNAIFRRTEGNPLFMVNLVEYLVDHHVMVEEQGIWKLCIGCSEVEHGVPSSVKELIEKQIERLSPDERSVLESASAAGMDFSTVAVAAGLDKPTEWVEKHCEELARRHQFLSPAVLGELPDGTSHSPAQIQTCALSGGPLQPYLAHAPRPDSPAHCRPCRGDLQRTRQRDCRRAGHAF